MRQVIQEIIAQFDNTQGWKHSRTSKNGDKQGLGQTEEKAVLQDGNMLGSKLGNPSKEQRWGVRHEQQSGKNQVPGRGFK